MKGVRGFTLIEMLVALVIFALIAGVAYATIIPAGNGFDMLKHDRDNLERAYQLDRQIRLDTRYLSVSADDQVQSLQVIHDQRGGEAHDQLWLLVKGSAPGLVSVHYGLDDKGELFRDSISPWARDPSRAIRWDIAPADSFEVQALDDQGRWRDTWDAKQMQKFPAALRVRWQDKKGQREALLPIATDYASARSLPITPIQPPIANPPSSGGTPSTTLR